MPNIFAYFMLLIWPLVGVYLFRKLDTARALIWTLLGGYLFLPPATTIVLPMLPDLDKYTVPSLVALVGVVLTKGARRALLPSGLVLRILLLIFILSPALTALTNNDSIFLRTKTLPGISVLEIPTYVFTQLIITLPFLAAIQVLRDEKSIRAVLEALALGGLIYSFPMIVEMRLSPQINTWVYGFFQHSFDQTVRFGGFRPIVFMPHGLWMALFALMCCLAAMTLMKEARGSWRLRYFLLFIYLSVIVVLCRSANASIYLLCFAPLLLLFGKRVVALAMLSVAMVVLFYPLIRGTGLIPMDTIVAWFKSINLERGLSFEFRVVNEDLLLARAGERPFFGWGGWGRNLVYDRDTGLVETITDGAWIISIGYYGWFGYISEFGLLVLPILSLFGICWRNPAAVSGPALGLLVIFTANLVDLLPNATIVPITWLISGAILGYCQEKRLGSRVPVVAKSAPAPWAQSVPASS